MRKETHCPTASVTALQNAPGEGLAALQGAACSHLTSSIRSQVCGSQREQKQPHQSEAAKQGTLVVCYGSGDTGHGVTQSLFQQLVAIWVLPSEATATGHGQQGYAGEQRAWCLPSS